MCAYSDSFRATVAVCFPAELGEAAGLYTTEAIVTGVVLSVVAAGVFGLGVVGAAAPGLPEEGQ